MHSEQWAGAVVQPGWVRAESRWYLYMTDPGGESVPFLSVDAAADRLRMVRFVIAGGCPIPHTVAPDGTIHPAPEYLLDVGEVCALLATIRSTLAIPAGVGIVAHIETVAHALRAATVPPEGFHGWWWRRYHPRPTPVRVASDGQWHDTNNPTGVGCWRTVLDDGQWLGPCIPPPTTVGRAP